MPRNTNNSSQSDRSIQTATNPSRSRRRNAPKHVSFENEQGNAIVIAAATAADMPKQKKEQEGAKMAQIQAENTAVRKALQVQQQEEALEALGTSWHLAHQQMATQCYQNPSEFSKVDCLGFLFD